MNEPYRIALRNDHSGDLDDVVVSDVSMFRAEMMDDKTLWMSCYLAGSKERVVFWVRATKRKGKKLALEFSVTEQPPESAEFPYEAEDAS